MKHICRMLDLSLHTKGKCFVKFSRAWLIGQKERKLWVLTSPFDINDDYEKLDAENLGMEETIVEIEIKAREVGPYRISKMMKHDFEFLLTKECSLRNYY